MLYLQHENPGPDRESNWLPIPAAPISIAGRMYGPTPQIIDREYSFPGPVRAES